MSKTSKREAVYRSVTDNTFTGKITGIVLQRNNVLRIGKIFIKRKRR